MGYEWLWQGVISSVVASIVFIVLSKVWPATKPYLLTITITTVACFFVAASISGMRVPQGSVRYATSETIEQDIRQWADSLGLTIRREEAGQEAFFSYEISMNDKHIGVQRLKKLPNYLLFSTRHHA